MRHCGTKQSLACMSPTSPKEIASYLAMTRGKGRCLYVVKDAKYRASTGYNNVEKRYFASPTTHSALGIEADTGLVAKACAV
jgi:hypothetical protein